MLPTNNLLAVISLFKFSNPKVNNLTKSHQPPLASLSEVNIGLPTSNFNIKKDTHEIT